MKSSKLCVLGGVFAACLAAWVIQDALGGALGLFKRKERPLPDFFDIGTPLSKEAADELRSVQKEFDVIDEEMWK